MNKQTNKIKKRYDRIAAFFDKIEHMIRPKWRKELLENLQGNILEVGVGTGANFEYYNEDATVTGIDFSPKMLEQASEKVKQAKATIKLKEMNIEQMDFPGNTFDIVVSTCVFCSVPNPIQGLKEIRRVVKPDGKIVMLEHMRSEQSIIGFIFDMFNPLTVRLIGTNINRKTIKNIEAANLKVLEEQYLMTSIVRKLVVCPNK